MTTTYASCKCASGNPLGHDPRRKVWVMYYSFLQFGPIVLSKVILRKWYML